MSDHENKAGDGYGDIVKNCHLCGGPARAGTTCPRCGAVNFAPNPNAPGAAGPQGGADWMSYRTDGCLFEDKPKPAPMLAAPQMTLPDRIDLRNLCSPIEDQRNTGSCVACSIVGALEFHQRKAGLPVTDLSRLFLYYNARALAGMEAQDSGSFIHHGMAALMAHGICEERMWPYQEAMFATRPTQACYQNATHYEAVQFARTPKGTPALTALAQGLPVVFGMSVPLNCFQVAGQTGVMPMPEELSDPGQMAGHAMTIVGYDIPERSYLIRNSWGESYGVGGYFKIPFDVMERFAPAEQFWTIGAIEQTEGFALTGPTMAEAAQSLGVTPQTQSQATAQREQLRGDIRSRLQSDLDAAKKDFRSRLRDK